MLTFLKIALGAGLAIVSRDIFPDRVRGAILAIAACIVAALVLHFAAPEFHTETLPLRHNVTPRIYRACAQVWRTVSSEFHGRSASRHPQVIQVVHRVIPRLQPVK